MDAAIGDDDDEVDEWAISSAFDYTVVLVICLSRRRVNEIL